MTPELIGVIEGGAIGLLSTAAGYVFTWVQLKSTRAFDLRQAVYVESVATMAAALEFFSKVSQLDVEDSELAGFVQQASSAAYKVHVVGTPGTIAAVASANECLTMAVLDLMTRRAALRATVDAGQAAHLQKALFLESMRASLRYQHELTEVNISARRELGLPLDATKYRAVNQAAEQKITAAIDSAICDPSTIEP